MPKVEIGTDEWYPVFDFIETVDAATAWDVCEVDDETLARWKRVFAEFYAVQKELKVARGDG